MSAAWKTNLSASRKIVLLALCDHANQDRSCFPSIPYLVEKCSLARRAIFSALDDLEGAGFVRRETRAGRGTTYHITDPCTWRTGAPDALVHEVHWGGAPDAPPPVHVVHPTRARGAPITISEPPSEPPPNPLGVAHAAQPAKKAKREAAGNRLPPDWQLSKSLGDWAMQERPQWSPADVREVAATFADYWHAQPGQRGRKTDWAATWRNWVRKEPHKRVNGHADAAGTASLFKGAL